MEKITFNNADELKDFGFEGFISIEELNKNMKIIPNEKGIYIVYYDNLEKPVFNEIGTGPLLYKKERNPNIKLIEIIENWVDGTKVLYIGKAGGTDKNGKQQSTHLRNRLSTYFSFGKGKDVRHWGGRLIWQINEPNKLKICWKKTPKEEPSEIESKLISHFKFIHSKRPFANLKD